MDAGAFLAGFSGLWVYIVVAVVVALTSVGPPGWFVPAQTCAVAAGALAGAGVVSLAGMVGAVYLGASLGCAAGYGLGSWFAARRPGWAPRGRLGPWWRYAVETLGRRTGVAVLTGRWNAALRACVPTAAGVSRVGWWRFLGWNALACALWAPAVVGAGVLIEQAAVLAQATLSTLSLVTLVTVTALLATGYRRWSGSRVDDPDGGDRRVHSV